jgi:hypothetical protein
LKVKDLKKATGLGNWHLVILSKDKTPRDSDNLKQFMLRGILFYTFRLDFHGNKLQYATKCAAEIELIIPQNICLSYSALRML